MSVAFNFSRRTWLARWVAALAGWPGAAIAATDLQILTTVVNITVPAGAFDPLTGLAEVTVSRGVVLQVSSDKKWKLRLRATNANFVSNLQPASGGTVKPVSDLHLRDAGGGRVLVPSTSFVEIANGKKTRDPTEYAFDLILSADSADAGGLYTAILEFDLR